MTTPTPAGAPGCIAASCTNPATVQWKRRTDPGHVVAVFSCDNHAISLDAAAHVHATTCAAPGPTGCTCTPEPIQPSTPAQATPPNLPPGWVTPATSPTGAA
ncbi:hypothetical protein ABZW30_12360 [Kitasatospora sp. NPDC004669]|uniref:hypothetical protein n=1 Tax=Kitasatospora sp. NPDC004669 TaxID=3154555 RepID=UPI0033A9950E